MKLLNGATIFGEVSLKSLADLQTYAGVLVVDANGKVYKGNVQGGGGEPVYYFYTFTESNQPSTHFPGGQIPTNGFGYIYLYRHGVMQTGSYKLTFDFHYSVNHQSNAVPVRIINIAATRRVEFNVYVDASTGLYDYVSELKVTHNSGVWLRRENGNFHSKGIIYTNIFPIELVPYPSVGQPEYYMIKLTNNLNELAGLGGGTHPMYVRYQFKAERLFTSLTTAGGWDDK